MLKQDTSQFINFIVGRQALWMKKELGGPAPWSDDPVYTRAKINNCFRRQDRFTKFELSKIDGLPFEEQVFRILIARHAISESMFNLMEPKKKLTATDINGLRSKIGSGNDFIGVCILFPNKPGFKREDRVLEHYHTVLKTYKMFAKKILGLSSAQEVVDLIRRTYPCLGPFRSYEVYTSLTYCPDFKFTEDDYLFIGPGSKDVMLDYLDVKNPGLKEAKELATIIGAQLKKAGCHIPGGHFTVRMLEDSFCEFRKYTKARLTGKPSKIYRGAK